MMSKMNWRQLLSSTRFPIDEHGRIVPYKSSIDPYRSPYQTDYDRVVFSPAFRRLGRKTQVHPLAQNDHTHNRLTHSVEVASVGRSLGNQAGILLQRQQHIPPHIAPYDIATIVQTACLAHDLGNPPFGHTGEEAIRHWFKQPAHQHYLDGLTEAERNDVQTYEGNAHSLRQIASLEMYQQQGGMRLTAAAIGTLIKYPWTSSQPEKGRRKFNIYQTELPIFQAVANELGLIPHTVHADQWARHPLSYLMEAADDICYALMDLEDAVSLELLHARDIEDLLGPLCDPQRLQTAGSLHQRIAMMRGLSIGRAVSAVADTFIAHHDDLLHGQLPEHDLLQLCPADIRDTLQAAKKLARERIFRHRSKLIHELAAFPCIGSILDVLIPAVHAQNTQEGSLQPQHSLALELLGGTSVTKGDSLYVAYMKVLDFVGGMTDNYAARMSSELSGNNML